MAVGADAKGNILPIPWFPDCFIDIDAINHSKFLTIVTDEIEIDGMDYWL